MGRIQITGLGRALAVMIAWLLACTAWSSHAQGRPEVASATAPADSVRAWPDSSSAAAALAQAASSGHLSAVICPLISGGWELQPGSRTVDVQVHWLDESGCPLPRGGETIIPWTDPHRISESIEAVAQSLVDAAAEDGHPLAAVALDSLNLGNPLQIWLKLTQGPKIRIGQIYFGGSHDTHAGFLRQVVGWRPGEPYRHTRWESARDRLWDTGLFTDVRGPFLLMPEGGLKEPLGDAGAKIAEADLLYELESAPAGQLTGVLGYAGAQARLFGYVDLALGNLFGTGRAAQLRWQGQEELESQFYLKWHEPYFLRFPISLDGTLQQVIQDTLYAETTWGLELGWFPAPRWQLSAGWDWSRLVLGGETGEHHRRQTARFGSARIVREQRGVPAGWAQRLAVSTTTGLASDVKRGRWEGRLWSSWKRMGVWLQQDGAVLAGADSLLQIDAFRLGGARSLRGTYEGAYRAFRYLLLRSEIGLRPAVRYGPRFYVLYDVAWIRPWNSHSGSVYGHPAESVWKWAVGFGLEVPTRAGDVILDFAVPQGSGVSQGRIHFGLVSRF